MYKADPSCEFKQWCSEHHLLKIKCPRQWLAYIYLVPRREHKFPLVLFLIILKKLRSWYLTHFTNQVLWLSKRFQIWQLNKFPLKSKPFHPLKKLTICNIKRNICRLQERYWSTPWEKVHYDKSAVMSYSNLEAINGYDRKKWKYL